MSHRKSLVHHSRLDCQHQTLGIGGSSGKAVKAVGSMESAEGDVVTEKVEEMAEGGVVTETVDEAAEVEEGAVVAKTVELAGWDRKEVSDNTHVYWP